MRTLCFQLSALLLACASVSHAQPSGKKSTPSPALVRAVIESFGSELSSYSFVPRPQCFRADTSVACKSHGNAAYAQFKSSLSKSRPMTGRFFRVSPLQDSAGTQFIDVRLELNNIEPGMMGIELFRLTVSPDGQRVLSRKVLRSDLSPMPTKR